MIEANNALRIDPERLARVKTLAVGVHAGPSDGMCAMEAAAWIVGEEWSDHPACVCPVIAGFMRDWNDNSSDDVRNTIILSLMPKIIGSRGSRTMEARRAYACADSAVRVFAPAALRACGIIGQADILAALPEIVDETTARAAYAAYAAALIERLLLIQDEAA